MPDDLRKAADALAEAALNARKWIVVQRVNDELGRALDAYRAAANAEDERASRGRYE